jgi:hypothetical protein
MNFYEDLNRLGTVAQRIPPLITEPRTTPRTTRTPKPKAVPKAKAPAKAKKEKKETKVKTDDELDLFVRDKKGKIVEPKDDMELFLDSAALFLKDNPEYQPKDGFMPTGLEVGQRGRGVGYRFLKVKDAPGMGIIPIKK